MQGGTAAGLEEGAWLRVREGYFPTGGTWQAEGEAGERQGFFAASAVQYAEDASAVPETVWGRTLRLEWDGADRVDVLTFPAWEGETSLSADGYLGDVMICYERAKEQAEQYGHSLLRELSFLAVHGCLHLLGYDHMTEADERVMREKQTAILEGIGVSR